jgi:hypothetical protein
MFELEVDRLPRLQWWVWPLLGNASVNAFPRSSSQHWKDVRCWVAGRYAYFRGNEEARSDRETIEGGDLYSVLPEVIKGGQVRKHS